MNAPTGIIDIRGKAYKSVALRVAEFREKHPDWALTAEVVERDQDCVVMRAAIADETGRVLATGHAEEYRKASQINRTSALENAETSAIGRALAALGFGGTEFASANEVENAIHQQSAPPAGAGGPEDEASARSASGSPTEYTFPPGPASGITQLKAMARELYRAVNACTTKAELDELTLPEHNAENAAVMKQMAALQNPAHREIWEGDGKDNPGLAGLITRKEHEFARQIADYATV